MVTRSVCRTFHPVVEEGRSPVTKPGPSVGDRRQVARQDGGDAVGIPWEPRACRRGRSSVCSGTRSASHDRSGPSSTGSVTRRSAVPVVRLGRDHDRGVVERADEGRRAWRRRRRRRRRSASSPPAGRRGRRGSRPTRCSLAAGAEPPVDALVERRSRPRGRRAPAGRGSASTVVEECRVGGVVLPLGRRAVDGVRRRGASTGVAGATKSGDSPSRQVSVDRVWSRPGGVEVVAGDDLQRRLGAVAVGRHHELGERVAVGGRPAPPRPCRHRCWRSAPAVRLRPRAARSARRRHVTVVRRGAPRHDPVDLAVAAERRPGDGRGGRGDPGVGPHGHGRVEVVGVGHDPRVAAAGRQQPAAASASVRTTA